MTEPTPVPDSAGGGTNQVPARTKSARVTLPARTGLLGTQRIAGATPEERVRAEANPPSRVRPEAVDSLSGCNGGGHDSREGTVGPWSEPPHVADCCAHVGVVRAATGDGPVVRGTVAVQQVEHAEPAENQSADRGAGNVHDPEVASLAVGSIASRGSDGVGAETCAGAPAEDVTGPERATAVPGGAHGAGTDGAVERVASAPGAAESSGAEPESTEVGSTDAGAVQDDVESGIVALWQDFGRSRDQELRDRLVLHYAPLVKYVAGRVGTGLPTHVEVSDLVQSGIFGLVDAIEKFEPERGLKFETYAMQRIRGAILDDLRSLDWVPRSVRSRARDVERALERLEARLQRSASDAELADEVGMSVADVRELFAQLQMTSVVALDDLIGGSSQASLAETLPDDSAEDPVNALVNRDSRRQLAEAVKRLSERDRIVVTLYYFENLTLAEIGKVLGVTESRVCQLHTRAVLRLRGKLTEQS